MTWRSSLGVCETCERLRKVLLIRGKWLCARCAKEKAK